MSELGPQLKRLRDHHLPPPRGFDRLSARRGRRRRSQRMLATGLGLGLFAALAGGLVWVVLRAEQVRPGTSPQQPIATAPSAEPSPESACVFPPYRPTYLPWLDSGEPVPEPDFRRLPGGGPQGLDPAYAILSWYYGDVINPGGPKLKGTLSLRRSTEPPGAFPTDPEVPPLPDGSFGGRLSRAPDSPPGSGDWSITWADESPSQFNDGCGETTLTLSLPNLTSEEVRNELLRVATSLVKSG